MIRQGNEERPQMDYRRRWDQEGIVLEGMRETLGVGTEAGN